MNQTIDQTPNMRVANFSKIDLRGDHVLNFDSEDVETIVNKIRTYADLPYVYVVSQENAGQVAELLSALRKIRSRCYPYALFSVDGADPDVDDTHLDIVKIGSADAETIRNRIREYASTRFSFDETKLRIANPGPMPTKVDVAVVGAGVTGLYAANKLMEAGISFGIFEKSDIHIHVPAGAIPKDGPSAGVANSTSRRS